MTGLSNTAAIAFIGFGELGQRFAEDFARRGDLRLTAYDLKLGQAGASLPLRDEAQRLGVALVTSAAGAIAGADVIFSAVTADQTYAVARDAAPLLRPGQFFVDINSASPGTKARAAALVNAAGAHYIEAAVMGAIKGPGITVEILTGGPEAVPVAARLNALGMSMTAVATAYGQASATKLCRSIMIKGMEALMVDCARASAHWGVQAPVYDSLARTFPGTDWYAQAAKMTERVETHGVRRAAEMREAADMLREMDLDAALATAVAAAQLRGVKKT